MMYTMHIVKRLAIINNLLYKVWYSRYGWNGDTYRMDNLIVPISIQNIEITDPLFGSYVRLVAEKIIPYQWEALNDRLPDTEKSYCIDNFRAASRKERGTHRGAIFQDSDAYKWLEAVAYSIENGSGSKFIEKADELIELICGAQEPDGYLNTYFTLEHPELKWKNLAEGHELYTAGHLIEAAVAYYKATGKDVLLNAVRRLADLIDTVFGPEEDKCKGYPGHQEIELALIKLSRVTGEVRYLKLAKHFIDERGKKPNYLMEEMKANGNNRIFPEFSEYDEEYAQTHKQPVEQNTAEGHAVRALYMYSAMADLAREYKDEKLEQACRTLFENLTTRRMYITGGIGSSGKLERFTVDYDLPNDHMYCESCASVGLMMFGQRMAALTKDASYYDAVERALCNTILAGISITGDRYFYVNPLEVWPDNCKSSTSLSHVKPVRQKWFSCSCCPPNIARTLASLGQYIYAKDNEVLYINQFISSKVHTTILENKVTVSMVSTYMQDGKIKINITAEGNQLFTLRVRIPSYLLSLSVSLNGKVIELSMEKGYALVPIAKEGEYQLELSASVPPVLVAANRNVRADIGRAAIMKGPFVYCLEQVDNGENLASLYINSQIPIQEEPALQEMPGDLPVISCEGERLTRTIANTKDLYSLLQCEKEPVKIKTIPYYLWCNRTPGEMQVWTKIKI